MTTKKELSQSWQVARVSPGAQSLASMFANHPIPAPYPSPYRALHSMTLLRIGAKDNLKRLQRLLRHFLLGFGYARRCKHHLFITRILLPTLNPTLYIRYGVSYRGQEHQSGPVRVNLNPTFRHKA